MSTRYALELLSAGTDGVGYLLKERVSDLEELSSSVQRVGQGGSVLDPAVVGQLVGRPRQGDNPLEYLTDREREVLLLISRGMSNAEIGHAFFLSEATVKTHVGRVLAKLGCRDRVQAVVFAFRTGFAPQL